MSLLQQRFATTSIPSRMFTGRDTAGDPTYGAQFQLLCRVEEKTEVVRDASGQEIRSASQVYTATPIAPLDRFWLPGANPANDNQARTPVSVQAVRNVAGAIQAWVAYF